MTQNDSSPPPPPPVGSKCEFKAYHETVKDGIPKSEHVLEPFAEHADLSDDGAYALVIKRSYQQEKPKKTSLTVNSSHILQAFHDVIRSYEPVSSDFTSSLTLQSPFSMLVHYWDKLDKYRQALTHAPPREHLDLLFEFMDRELRADRDEALKMIQKGQITFKNAWVIYPPGEVLYREFMGEPWLLVCNRVVYEENPDDGPYLEIHAVYTDHDGIIVGDVPQAIQLSQRSTFPQDDPVNITDLQIYPRKFVQRGDSLERHVRERGEKFLALKDKSTVKYSGPAEWHKSPPEEYYDISGCKYCGVWLPYTETGRVILDRKTFREERRMGHIGAKFADPKPWLCPPYTIGYSLGRKQWVHVLVDHIQSPGWIPNTWDRLVLPDKEKTLLRSLVSSHKYSDNPRDQSQQKGKGLVILLHGTPGSGKTLTAEVAAEASKKALVATSMGELNQASSFLSGSFVFGKKLKKVLQYATIWEAVVLLDEADVFLEARTDNNSERNALVATFLKELEYFSGIVFLTTNRVSSFDKAMKSRVHLALGYTPPTADVRRQIWRRYLSAVPAGQSVVDIDGNVNGNVNGKGDVDVNGKSDVDVNGNDGVNVAGKDRQENGNSSVTVLDKLATAAELNGREIAYIVTTACTMARFERKPLALGHLETVLEVRRTFDENLNGVRQGIVGGAS
ncbi:putative TOB3 [Rosellinia necatrix]|uniref:Putative TOB3 n=1 Tax=Rosellinia necatrix TaxID=77044 RepID=A0A1W2TFN3_ROSNE|nr:putative TOB3 [Rosellinia necatrix]